MNPEDQRRAIALTKAMNRCIWTYVDKAGPEANHDVVMSAVISVWSKAAYYAIQEFGIKPEYVLQFTADALGEFAHFQETGVVRTPDTFVTESGIEDEPVQDSKKGARTMKMGNITLVMED